MNIDELIAMLESGSERGNEYDDDLMRKAAETIRVLNAVPAADVVEIVRHGRWIESYSGWTPTKKCSACDTHFTQFPMKIVAKGEPIKPVLNFCPNCGAKMDGGQDDA